MIYFTSDTHFGHANVIRFAGRPWQTIEQMDAALVAGINVRVGMRDELWILGDFSYRLGRDEALAIRQSITCRRVHLVPGNHDRNWAVPELEGAFLLEPPIAKIKYEGHRFVCSHYPIMDWEGMPSSPRCVAGLSAGGRSSTSSAVASPCPTIPRRTSTLTDG